MTLPTETAHPELEGLGKYEYGWADRDDAGASARRGLNEDVVRDISSKKDEPEWMTKLRLKGLRLFEKRFAKHRQVLNPRPRPCHGPPRSPSAS